MKEHEVTQLADAPVLAGRYKVSPRTILSWAANGVIPTAVRVGRVVRFDVDEVDAVLRRKGRGQGE